MDFLHENSVSAIETLQTNFPQQRDMFFTISNVGDPRYAFTVFAPLLFSFNWSRGKKLMLVTVLAEWSNQILKWVLHGERPYWWVHETQIYNRTGAMAPAIQQYSLTCETGPGSPSGHAMVSAAIWYILMDTLIEKMRGNDPVKNRQSMLSSFLWSAYTVYLIFVSLSRVYIAAHFPHQCVLGIIIGCGMAMLINKVQLVDNLKLRHYVIGTIGLLGTALATFALLKMMGMNPLWSVDRAVKWCAKQEYIHLDTTPFFSMMRYCGFFLGMGLGLHSTFYKTAEKATFSFSMKMACALLSVGICMMSSSVPMPKSANINVIYLCAFTLNTILPYVTIAVVPYVVSKGWPTESSQSSMAKKVK